MSYNTIEHFQFTLLIYLIYKTNSEIIYIQLKLNITYKKSVTKFKENFPLIIPLNSPVLFHIKTSYWFCRTKQMTGFYMKRNTRLKWVKIKSSTKFYFPFSFTCLITIKKCFVRFSHNTNAC